MPLKLYELVGTDPSRPFSPFCWRTRMALAHKGLSAETIPWCCERLLDAFDGLARKSPSYHG